MTRPDETLQFMPKWDASGLLPVVVVDADSHELLMVAYANEEALRTTLSTGEAHYWSRSRASLWHKGTTSGAIQRIDSIGIDCDQDTLVYRVRPQGPACHTGEDTCFYRQLASDENGRIQLTDHKL